MTPAFLVVIQILCWRTIGILWMNLSHKTIELIESERVYVAKSRQARVPISRN